MKILQYNRYHYKISASDEFSIGTIPGTNSKNAPQGGKRNGKKKVKISQTRPSYARAHNFNNNLRSSNYMSKGFNWASKGAIKDLKHEQIRRQRKGRIGPIPRIRRIEKRN
ncbi:hypothetical protein C922_04229 [Plasmodium inui San Antonio 1]|uniref:Uncharacterized protein n=1 Tax=Plasmodium inui San Antonio 1 TaxID=1237626 RepID=W7A8K3_9APIC|nr:hypothetical protein C922_04229 [Plasmodium inui San Antonio 1]EUD65489.1 hypothetical protein C922_04229 [Plasmodium inui San Antonio 1]